MSAYILNHVRFYTKSSVRHRRKDFLISYRQAEFFFPEIFKENIVEFTSHKYVNILRDAIRGENDSNYIMETIKAYKNEKDINGKYSSDFGIALFWLERDCKKFSKEDMQKLILFFDKEAKNISNGFAYRIKLYKLALTAGESEMAEQGFKKLLREAKRNNEYSKHIDTLQKINDVFKKAHKKENKKTNV